MKGVILAGGNDMRLFPNTKVVNKHLLPVFNKPMIYYPVETLKKSGLREILIIADQSATDGLISLLGSGKDFDLDFTYKVQDGSSGDAHALQLAQEFSKGEPLAVIFGDNIFENHFAEEILYFQKGAQIFLKKSDTPELFGVVELDKKGDILSLREKPAFSKSALVQTGFFLYDAQVFDFIEKMSPSEKGLYQLTEVNKMYLEKKHLKASQIFGMWIDAGSHETLLEASILAQETFDPDPLKKRKKQPPNKVASELPKVTVGLVTKNAENSIEACLKSLLAQDYQHLEIIIFDNHSTDNTLAIIQQKFPDIRCIKSTENVGISQGHNEILRHSQNEFYATLHPETIVEPQFVSLLVKAFQDRPMCSSLNGKIKKWDLSIYEKNPEDKESGKTNFIDSIGIKIYKSHKFENIGQGEVDYGQYETSKEIFGVSGNVALYRRQALEDIAYMNEKTQRKEIFDESLFMYKEDIDLAYRLQWAGWKAFYIPEAVAYFYRESGIMDHLPLNILKAPTKKERKQQRFSYLNHQLLLKKNYSPQYSGTIRGATFWYNTKVFMYLLIFETELLSEWWKIFRMRKKINHKKSVMPRRVSCMEIERFMER